MIAYTDKIVGRFVKALEEQGIADNTLLIFTADNGTHFSITSATRNGMVQGAKGNTIDAGTHVPMIISWPAKIKKPMVYDGLIEFSDFYPTLADVAGKPEASDGKSFYPLLNGDNFEDRSSAFVHYDPQWGKRVNQFRNQFARTERYKLYQDGKFYDLDNDRLEEKPIAESDLTPTMQNVKSLLQKEIDKAPKWVESK